jgi:hypothetical protein
MTRSAKAGKGLWLWLMSRFRPHASRLAGVLLVAALVGAPSAAPTSVNAATTAIYLVGAGDIATCDSQWDERTADLLGDLPGTVVTLGDNAYERGTTWEYNHCYAPSWGRYLKRTKPSAGNHDYLTPNAAGYFGYFGERAGTPGRGWYAFDRGTWRVYVLNSNCGAVGGCWVGSAQEKWLRADLAAHPRPCVVAYWHHPRFSSGFHGNATSVGGLWRTLYAAGADLVLNGHDHDYERFAPQDPQAQPDAIGGIREFVVGTGGAALRGFETVKANSELRSAAHHGVLRLRLGEGWYRWRFFSADGADVDAGNGTCH